MIFWPPIMRAALIRTTWRRTRHCSSRCRVMRWDCHAPKATSIWMQREQLLDGMKRYEDRKGLIELFDDGGPRVW